MPESPLQKLVRNFPENGPKLLLENPANLRDLLLFLGEPKVHAIDFQAMTLERTHFVQPDYQHVALDLLFKAPFRVASDDPPRSIFIYLLLEHQSRPERFFMLRLAEYIVEVYKMQKRAWDKSHTSDANLVLQPVIPIVLYTGERHWEKPKRLADVVDAGALFAPMIPEFQPHFLNLSDTAPDKLARDGGFFGQVLWLIRDRHAEPQIFRRTLEEVVATLEKMPDAERARWVEFLSYIVALVYHARSPEEQSELRDVVDRSVQTDPHRKEFTKMGQTIAEMYIEKGRTEGIIAGKIEGIIAGKIEGKREAELASSRAILLKLLRKRFKKVPRKLQARITATTELPMLETWLDNFANAKTMEDVGIPLD